MSIRSVESAIRYVRAVVKEWDEAGFGYDNWREEHTRYAIIDPLISALGWNTADPMILMVMVSCMVRRKLNRRRSSPTPCPESIVHQRVINPAVRFPDHPAPGSAGAPGPGWSPISVPYQPVSRSPQKVTHE